MKRIFLVSMLVLPLAGCLDSSDSSKTGDNSGSVPPGGETQVTRFSVLPYLQNPTDTGTTIVWFTDTETPGRVEVDGVGMFESLPTEATHLSYGASEVAYIHSDKNFGNTHATLSPGATPPSLYKHRIRIEKLTPATTYSYTVVQSGAEESFSSEFKTAAITGSRAPVRFIAMSDMETEPESTQKTVQWTANGLATDGEKLGTDPSTYNRHYPVDQTTGYKANIQYATQRQPDFWVIAGDLVEKGGRQLDWDEFWRHAAGEWNTLASTTPIFPALGNHENYWHPDKPGYNTEASLLSYDKWNTYWELPENFGTDERYEKRYYRADYGPVTLITLDSSNGDDSDPAKDTNLMLNGTDSRIPDFNQGSEQWDWAERELASAQAAGQIIFVQFHHTAFGTGVHSMPSGSAGIAEGEDSQSGMPMRIYRDLFERYGVTAVLTGHDELLEYVEMNDVHYWDVGFAGDGLRGPGYPPTTDYVPFDLLPPEAQATHWSAHGDAPEIWSGNQLIDGGKHYGFMEVDVRPIGDFDYEVVMTPHYVFPLMNEAGEATGEFDQRQYDKVVSIKVKR